MLEPKGQLKKLSQTEIGYVLDQDAYSGGTAKERLVEIDFSKCLDKDCRTFSARKTEKEFDGVLKKDKGVGDHFIYNPKASRKKVSKGTFNIQSGKLKIKL